jgi:hypothetical protein
MSPKCPLPAKFEVRIHVRASREVSLDHSGQIRKAFTDVVVNITSQESDFIIHIHGGREGREGK